MISYKNNFLYKTWQHVATIKIFYTLNANVKMDRNFSSAHQFIGITTSYFILVFMFVIPIFVFLGIFSNIAILFTIFTGRAHWSKTSKFYYGFIAFGDLLVCCKTLLLRFLCESLWLYSGGSTYFCFDSFSDVTCKLLLTLNLVAEVISNNSLLAMSIERLVAMMNPLRARRILNKKFTLSSFILLIGLPSLTFVVLIPAASVVEPSDRITGYVCKILESKIFGKLVNAVIAVVFTLSLEASFVLNVIIVVKLRKAINIRISKLSVRRNSAVRGNLRTVICLTICVIHIILYQLGLIMFVAKSIIRNIDSISSEFKAYFYNLFLSVTFMSIIPHSVNLFVYLILIPGYWKAFTRNHNR